MLLRFNGLRYSSARCTTLGYSLLCGAATVVAVAVILCLVFNLHG